MIDNEDPQQMHGYSYANNAPVTASDPDGMWPKWLDKAASAVSDAVSTATKAVTNAVSTGAKWVYNNAGTISTVLGAAALACSVIPPLQVVAPFLGAAAAVAGAIDTYKSCAGGAGLDCAVGIAGMVPGGRILGAVGKAAKNAERAMDSADDIGDAAKAARRGGGPSCPTSGHSFDAATPVLMADGTHRAIRDVRVDDEVLATNPQTGATSAERVTDLHRNTNVDLTDLTVTVDPDPTLAGDESTKVIQTTWNHPFWAQSRQAWVDAGSLKPGDELKGVGGSTTTVRAVRNYIKSRLMLDLTVAEIHTYYVIVDRAAVLVHNCKPGDLFDVPRKPGAYTIHLADGSKYVGSATRNMRNRVNKAISDGHAVREAGYSADDIVNVTWTEVRGGFRGGRYAARWVVTRLEQAIADGWLSMGKRLVNRDYPIVRQWYHTPSWMNSVSARLNAKKML